MSFSSEPLAVLAATVISGFALAACGETQTPQESAATTTTTAVADKQPAKAAASATGKTIKTGKTNYGRILQDGRGHTIYLFTKEQSKKSRCFGDCARAWPPVYTKGKPQAGGGGVKQSRLGTVKHGNKTQATYNGHPLYYYVDEDEPNEILCQAVFEFGGYWYIVNKNGNAITAKG
jgi:predicted lipoprotein with Yx(FWY)xxD motif